MRDEPAVKEPGHGTAPRMSLAGSQAAVAGDSIVPIRDLSPRTVSAAPRTSRHGLGRLGGASEGESGRSSSSGSSSRQQRPGMQLVFIV